MPETPEELYARAASALRMPPLDEWDTWPFEGALRPKALARPVEREAPRRGEGGVDCHACSAPDGEYLWTDRHWRLRTLAEPCGLPVVMLLEPREHVAEPGDLTDELAAELGVMIARVDRAICSLEGVGRVHNGRWGEGAEHLHWWFLARPARFEQLRSSFAEIWDGVLPPTPEHVWRGNAAAVARALAS